tara:strand:- start:100 stop:372 length:273 start_codon:yes stop_codon:yes gene_type:complete
MGQLALTVKESLKTLALDNNTENGVKVSSIQNRYIDSVELSDRAIQLSMQADTETRFKEETDTDLAQEEVPAANPLQEVFTRALALNVLA